jgi:hypothetical protein
MGFTATLDDMDSVVESAGDKLKAMLRERDGPFWNYWVEYCAWDNTAKRVKPRIWRYSQVAAVKNSSAMTELAPKWGSLKATEFIGRLVVRFLNDVGSSPDDIGSSSPACRFQQDDEDEGFRHAYAICAFIKDSISMSEWLEVSDEEVNAMRATMGITPPNKVSIY